MRLLTVLFSVFLCLVGDSPLQADSRPSPEDARAAGFDALLAEIRTGREGTGGEAALARLQQLIPPGDVLRALDYQTAHCSDLVRRDPEGALALATRQMQEALRLGATEARIHLHYCQGIARGVSTTPANALADFDAGIELAREHGLLQPLGIGLVQRGSVRSLLGEQALALIDFLDATGHFRTAGDTFMAEANLLNIATAYRRMGEDAKALEYLEESAAAGRRNNNSQQLFIALIQTGFLHETAGRAEKMHESFEAALAVAQDGTGQRQDMGYARLGLAGALVELGRPGEALRQLDAARADFSAVGDASTEDYIAFLAARAYAGLGEQTRALALFAEAEQAFQDAGNERYLQMLYEARAGAHESHGDAAAALADFRRYMELRNSLDERMRDERATVLRHQFDVSRRELENEALRDQQRIQAQRLEALTNARRWQNTTMALGGILILLLLALSLRQISRLRRLRALASTDGLTGLPNRRSIEHEARQAVARAHGSARPLSALVMDVDHFKQINDTWGHATGDLVLQEIAAACQLALRPSDLIGRTGGEEFLVVLPGSSRAQAARVAGRLCTLVAELPLAHLQPGLEVTMSVGVAQLRKAETLEALIARADRALYRAKRNGRNRFEIDDGQAPPAEDLAEALPRERSA